MAQVRHYDHNETTFVITVNKNGTRYEATLEIPGMQLRQAERQIEADSREGAFRAAKMRAERLIEHAPVVSTALPAIDY